MTDDSGSDPVLPIECWVENFDVRTARRLHRKIQRCMATEQNVLPVFIGSCGGSVWELGAMQDLIASSPVSVATIAIGKTLSAGADLLAAGTSGFRCAMPGATIMVHESKDAVVMAKVREVSADAKEAERAEKLFFDRLDKNCGKPRGYFMKQLAKRKYVDWWMSPKEAKKHGLVDSVGVPLFSIATSSELRLSFREEK